MIKGRLKEIHKSNFNVNAENRIIKGVGGAFCALPSWTFILLYSWGFPFMLTHLMHLT
jgi:hypothetical protein